MLPPFPSRGLMRPHLVKREVILRHRKAKPTYLEFGHFFLLFLLGKGRVPGRQSCGRESGCERAVSPHGTCGKAKRCPCRPGAGFQLPLGSPGTVPHLSASGSFQSIPEPGSQRKREAGRQYNLTGPRCMGSSSALLLTTVYSPPA